jgi:hypothetical protein
MVSIPSFSEHVDLETSYSVVLLVVFLSVQEYRLSSLKSAITAYVQVLVRLLSFTLVHAFDL